MIADEVLGWCVSGLAVVFSIGAVLIARQSGRYLRQAEESAREAEEHARRAEDARKRAAAAYERIRQIQEAQR